MKSKVLALLIAAMLLTGVSPVEAGQTPSPIPVPEPASLILFGTGLGVMALTIRRLRRQKK